MGHREQNSSCPVTWDDEPRGFLTEWEAAPLKPTEDAKMKNDEAGRPMPEAFKDPHHLANTADAMGRLCKSWQGSTAEYHFACRDTIRAQAERIAELEGELARGLFGATTPFGWYHVWEGHYQAPCDKMGQPAIDPRSEAQADYEARILAALEGGDG